MKVRRTGMPSPSEADRYYREARMKFLRDEATRRDAVYEEAHGITFTEACRLAYEQGLKEGRLVGKIQSFQELLEEDVTSKYGCFSSAAKNYPTWLPN